MSIERMEFVNIAGLTKDLDAVLVKLSECGCFHIESASKLTGKEKGFSVLKEENPYTPVLKRLSEISALTGVKYENTDCEDIENTPIIFFFFCNICEQKQLIIIIWKLVKAVHRKTSESSLDIFAGKDLLKISIKTFKMIDLIQCQFIF